LPDVGAQFREYIRLDRKQRSGGLTPAELERWTRLKRSLGQKFSPGLTDEQSDRRSSVRVPAQLQVDFQSIAELRGKLMTNLSRGGLFVATTHLLDIGTRVTLHITVESSGERLEIPAEVVSQNVGPRFESDPPGIGLRFLDMDADVAQRLDELYEETLQDAARRSVLRRGATK
jgi:type IV pilus assembly protein PilZ